MAASSIVCRWMVGYGLRYKSHLSVQVVMRTNVEYEVVAGGMPFAKPMNGGATNVLSKPWMTRRSVLVA